MKAFISYSHADSAMLDKLHTHLAQLTRENLLSSWADREIIAGGVLNSEILRNLESSDLFIALLSPDYIASKYCYEKEFTIALDKVIKNEIIIVPIIIEPCDWKSTPFKDFKALPTDGKPISEWQNVNTAFLNIIQELRKLIKGNDIINEDRKPIPTNISPSRNYKVKKDFDSIQKMEFKENSFKEIKKFLKDYLAEVELLDNIKKRIITENETNFEAIIVNRNKVNTECKLRVTIEDVKQFSNNHFFRNSDLSFSFDDNWNQYDFFEIANDEFEMYWLHNKSNISFNKVTFQSNAKNIADTMWEAWLERVGIV